MSNNVYIGSRYVPLFDGAWNNTKVYEPLTIVEYGNSSYTSKKSVPAGTLPTNTTYWALTGNYNGQIADLRTDLDALDDEVDDLINKNNRYISVKIFGAKGDGVTDDGAAIIQAITHCNSSGQILYFEPGTYNYHYTTSTTVNCSIDFGGAKIVLFADNASNNIPFVVGNSGTTYTGNQSSLTKNTVTVNTLKNKSFVVKTPLSLGLRYGSGDEAFYRRLITTDDAGNITNGEFMPTISNGTYDFVNIRDYTESGLFIKNAVISSGSLISAFVKILRDNVSVSDIVIDYPETGTYSGLQAVIYLTGVCHCSVKNISGNNPFPNNNSGYVISMDDCFDITIEKVNSNNKSAGSWGALKQEQSENISYFDCITRRLDIHHTGNLYANNCNIDFFNYSGGYGNIILDKCHINLVTDQNAFITFRDDYMLLFSGKIIFRGCTFSTELTGTRYLIRNYMRRTPVVNASVMNYRGLEVVFEDCDIGVNTALNLTMLSITTDDYASNFKLTFVRCKINASQICGTYDTHVMDSIKFIDCVFTYTGDNLCNNVSSFKNVEIDDSKFVGVLKESSWDHTGGMISIINNYLHALSLNNADNVRVINNTIDQDVAYANSSSPTHQVRSGNLIIASTNTNQASWNT